SHDSTQTGILLQDGNQERAVIAAEVDRGSKTLEVFEAGQLRTTQGRGGSQELSVVHGCVGEFPQLAGSQVGPGLGIDPHRPAQKRVPGFFSGNESICGTLEDWKVFFLLKKERRADEFWVVPVEKAFQVIWNSKPALFVLGQDFHGMERVEERLDNG